MRLERGGLAPLGAVMQERDERKGTECQEPTGVQRYFLSAPFHPRICFLFLFGLRIVTLIQISEQMDRYDSRVRLDREKRAYRAA